MAVKQKVGFFWQMYLMYHFIFKLIHKCDRTNFIYVIVHVEKTLKHYIGFCGKYLVFNPKNYRTLAKKKRYYFLVPSSTDLASLRYLDFRHLLQNPKLPWNTMGLTNHN